MARFQIPLPPLPELRQAVAKFGQLLKKVERLEDLYAQRVAALDALKRSVLQRAFSGALRTASIEGVDGIE